MQAADELFRIAGLAAGALGVPVGRIERVERLKGGLTNTSWRAVSGAGDVVVRLSTADEAALQIDRLSECRVLALIQESGLGPQVLRCDPAARVLVTAYIAGPVWTRRDAVMPENIARLAHLLRRLHALPVRAELPQTDLVAILIRYWATLADRGLPDPPGAVSREAMLRVASDLDRQPGRCLCHNDLNHLNVLDTGRLWLIDWEYAGMGSPWFDLASASCNQGFDEAQRQKLLEHYLGGDASKAAGQLRDACLLFDYIRQLWLIVRSG